MVFHLDLQKQAASGKNKRQARKNKRKSRNKESGAAPFCTVGYFLACSH